jgi:CRISPR-associated protein Cas2
MSRHLFLIAYDIAHARRRRIARRLVKGNSIGGQKSLYECWMTQGELQTAMASLRRMIDPVEDRIVVIQLDPRASVHTRGVGVEPQDGSFFFQG